jgi:hypothetical protein
VATESKEGGSQSIEDRENEGQGQGGQEREKRNRQDHIKEKGQRGSGEEEIRGVTDMSIGREV